MRNFHEMLKKRQDQGFFVCVGLDPDYVKIPKCVKMPFVDFRGVTSHYGNAGVVWTFSKQIVQATRDLVCAYKLNAAFYEALGESGTWALQGTMEFIIDEAPDIPIILDVKRGDIGNTNDSYARMAFDYFCADAITVHPYLGYESLEPFLKRKDKGIFVLCRTSNKGAGEFQDLLVSSEGPYAKPLYEIVAQKVATRWNTYGNCGLVVGATYPNELKKVREIVGDNMPILIPGIGAQGGDLEKTLEAGKNSQSGGMIINSSRGIIFASSGDDFAEAARQATEELHNSITKSLRP